MNVQESEFDQLVAGISLECDGTIEGEGGCPDPVKWYMTYHGCNAEILCEPHTTEFVAHAIYTLSKYGSIICTECNTEFYRLSDFIRTRPV